MASVDKTFFSTLCYEDDVSTDAATWCIDCETFLCSDCKRHHGRNKACKQHRVISIEDYQNLPSFILKTSNRCDDHDKRYELYCRFHECACCMQCLDDKHRKCGDLTQLSSVLGNIKSPARVTQLGRDLEDLGDDLKAVKAYLANISITVEVEKSKGIEKIQKMRKSINDNLDKIEQKLLDDLSSEHTKIILKSIQLMNEAIIRAHHIGQLQKNFTQLKTFATDLQTFLGTQTIEKMKAEEAKYLEDVQARGELDETHLQVDVSSALASIADVFISLGNILVSSIPANLQLKSGREARLQMSVSNVTDITQINPKLKISVQIPNKTNMVITGCQILPDGQMLFVDRNNKCLMLFSKDGVYIRDVITFGTKPFEVCYVTDNIVAVTSYTTKEVKVIDIVKNEITRSFDTNDSCYGIECDQRYLIVTTEATKQTSDLLAIDLQAYDKQVSKMKKLDAVSNCVTCFENKIYLAYFRTNSVTCYQRNGGLLWTYKHEDIKEPRSLSVDRHGIVYVCCYKTNKIVVLTPDGKQSRVILSHDDGLDAPFTLNIDRKTSTLLVGNFDDGHAFLFQI